MLFLVIPPYPPAGTWRSKVGYSRPGQSVAGTLGITFHQFVSNIFSDLISGSVFVPNTSQTLTSNWVKICFFYDFEATRFLIAIWESQKWENWCFVYTICYFSWIQGFEKTPPKPPQKHIKIPKKLVKIVLLFLTIKKWIWAPFWRAKWIQNYKNSA